MANTNESPNYDLYGGSSREILEPGLQIMINPATPKNISTFPILIRQVFPYAGPGSDREYLPPALYDSRDPRNILKMKASELISAAGECMANYLAWNSTGNSSNAAVWQHYLDMAFVRAGQLEAAGLLTAEDFAGIGMLNWRFGEALREPLGKSEVPKTLDGILGEVKLSEADAALIHDLMSLG